MVSVILAGNGSPVLYEVLTSKDEHRESSIMFPAWPINKLQRASATVSYQQTIRTFSQRTFFVGIFFFFLGAISYTNPFAAIPPVVIGIWLVVYAATMRNVPPPKAFRIGDTSGIIAFACNSLILLYEIAVYTRTSGELPRALPGIFLFIIAFGFVHFTYKRTAQFAPPPFDKDEEAQFKGAIAALVSSDYRSNDNIIHMIINSTHIRGALHKEFVVFIAEKGREVSVLVPRDFEIVAESANTKEKETMMKVRMMQQWVTARIDNTSYTRYQKWLTSE